MTEYFYTNNEQCLKEALQHVKRALDTALAKYQKVTLMVSGGRTPQALYQALSKQSLDWQRIHIALVDERWVDLAHAASNEAFIRQNLLINRAVDAPFTAMKNAAATAQEGLAECEAAYAALPPVALCILGMGPDAHTASLFPAAQGLTEAMRLDSAANCAAITAQQSAVTGEHTERMTLTLAAILRSEAVMLLINGDEKKAVYRKVENDYDPEQAPVSAVLRDAADRLAVFWAP